MKRALATIALIAFPFGCAEEDPTPSVAACPEGQQVGDVCAGVPSEPLCTGGSCTVGSCNQTYEVAGEAQLGDAVAGAQPGDCIALAPGSYGAVDLPVQVSLFGRSADETHVASVTTRGADVRVRGISVEGGSALVLDGETRFDGVRILDSASDALSVAAGASAVIERSEIRRATRYGVSAFDATAVTISSTIVEDSGGPGAWFECTAGCACSTPVAGSVSGSLFRGNSVVGLSIVGAEVDLTNVEIRESTTDDAFSYGGGVAISKCSTVTADHLGIIDSVDFGMLIDDSTVTVTSSRVENNLRGIAIQNIGLSSASTVSIDGTMVMGNRGVGIGVDGGSSAVSVSHTEILDTKLIALPVKIDNVSAGVEEVGDGVAWLGISQVSLDSVTVSGSARAAVLIDGEVGVGSTITDLQLAGGDEGKGVIQQNLPSAGEQPTVSGSTPSPATYSDEQFSIPLDISVPPGI